MNKDAVISIIIDSVKAELTENWRDDLTGKEREFILEKIKYMSEEMIALALEQDEKKKDYHRTNIEHYKSALLSIEAISKIKAFNSMVNIIGRVIAGVAIATGKALI